MQYAPIAPGSKRKMHEPNFIAASIACPSCIKSGAWKESLRGKPRCEVCGEHRNIAFCQRSFRETQMDKQVVAQNPLEAFVKWILYDLPIKYDTVAISHYGGEIFFNITSKWIFRPIRYGSRIWGIAQARAKPDNDSQGKSTL